MTRLLIRFLLITSVAVYSDHVTKRKAVKFMNGWLETFTSHFNFLQTPALLFDPVIWKLDPFLRYQYVQGADGTLYFVDLWVKASDLVEAAKYDAEKQNVYHLYTRKNHITSQPLMHKNVQLLNASNFDPKRRTVMIVHGWLGDKHAAINDALVPAFLEAEDLNVIAVDWGAGGSTANYIIAVINTATAGMAMASFVDWLNQETGATAEQYHLLGHSLGGHVIGLIGRNVNGTIQYITGLDPAGPGFYFSNYKLQKEDAAYTEVIHTNAGFVGHLSLLGHVDFFPNGGSFMSGCWMFDLDCSHSRVYKYMAHSLTRGGFKGRKCSWYGAALIGLCYGESLNMGGLNPKIGSSGIYHLQTDADPPFSRELDFIIPITKPPT